MYTVWATDCPFAVPAELLVKDFGVVRGHELLVVKDGVIVDTEHQFNHIVVFPTHITKQVGYPSDQRVSGVYGHAPGCIMAHPDHFFRQGSEI